MRSVGIKVLKNKLSEYVRLAASGETVRITDRNRVVAELTPPRPGLDKPDVDARWAELIRQGMVTPAKNPREPLPPRNYPALMTFAELMAELDKDRENR
jgi:prevent-host-death family protein